MFDDFMSKILEQAQRKLYEQVDDLRKAGLTEAPCRKCHTLTPLDDLRPKVISDNGIATGFYDDVPTVRPEKDSVELGLCCPACVQGKDQR